MTTPQEHEDAVRQGFRQARQAMDEVLEQLQAHTLQWMTHDSHWQDIIAKHQQTEQELRRANQVAQEATRLKDKFVSLVAHDLKSPLSAMLGLLELIESDLDHPLHQEQQELLKNAVDSGQHMIKLIKNLLDISRLQSGKITLEPCFCDGQVLVRDVLARIALHAERKSIVLNNAVPPHTRLHGDRHLLSEVIQNLLTNAIKFSHPGQEVVIRVVEERPNILLHVSDQGVGIPVPLQERIFRVEEKFSTPGTAGEEGTGFGLPFSRDIMVAHKGDLTVTSHPGQGSCFTMHLPYVQPRVVLVDDLRAARLMFRSILEPLNLAVEEAVDGRDALAVIQRFAPHLVISDIIMPDMDGFEMLAQLRANPATAHLAVILVTTDEKIETRELAFALGADDFVTKPVILCDFLPRIRRIVI